MSIKSFACLALVAAVTACGTSSTNASIDGGNGSGSGSDGSGNNGSGTSSNGQLKILSLTTTTPTITGGAPLTTEPSSVTFVAIVTDSKGLDTIAGGQLLDASGATYTAFEAGASMGTYTAALSFYEMNQLKPLDFPVGGGTMPMTAQFFDNDGNSVKATVSVGLACRDDYGLEGACSGVCTDTSIDGSNCGACGTACGAGLECTGAGGCVPVPLTTGAYETSCVNPRAVVPGTNCAQICSAAGSGRACYGGGIGKLERYPNTTCAGTNYDAFYCTEGITPELNTSYTCGCD